MPGTDMTQGKWDQLRELMRKAEQAGKVNELITVHRKEVKNVPMNKVTGDQRWMMIGKGARKTIRVNSSNL